MKRKQILFTEPGKAEFIEREVADGKLPADARIKSCPAH